MSGPPQGPVSKQGAEGPSAGIPPVKVPAKPPAASAGAGDAGSTAARPSASQGSTPAGGPPPSGATAPPVTGPGAEASPNGDRRPEDMTLGELVFEVSDRASVLVREEVELAKAEVTEKLNRLLQGSVTALVAGVFVLAALAMIMHGIAWLLNDLFFEDDVWAGFLIEAAVFLIIAAAGGLFAYRAFQKASPPVPEMAIEEAKEIRTAFEQKGSR